MIELSFKEYYNRVFGSWLGRVVGDSVAIPVEMWSYDSILKKYGEITYFPESINFNHVNDDEMYEIVALIAMEKYGINLNAQQLGQEWLNLLSRRDNIFTAEKIAYDNLEAGILPPKSGILNNFYYDFIGAQMRADIWGQIAPGCPEIAKEYAQMDGSISHAGIGIEGEVYLAVLISQAFFESEIRKNIESALKFLPPKKESLYTEMVLKAIEIYENNKSDFRAARKILIEEYWIKEMAPKILKSSLVFQRDLVRSLVINSGMGKIHTLPNIGIIILSLLYGAQDKEDTFGRSTCIAAMMGYDNDCNCGNIGALLGVQLGAGKIPEKWKDPLQDTFSTFVKGYEKWKISELSRRIANIGREVINKKAQNLIRITG
ncbi:MAG: ADP-ribosylglycohydrolase family protein [Candidatus Hermodarchaeota archaeon]